MELSVDKELLKRAVERWGKPTQTIKVQEEALELALAINQYQCPTKDRTAMLDQIYDELADNLIMVNYYDLLFDGAKIQQLVQQKLSRLERILDQLDEDDQEAADEERYERSVSKDQE